MMIDTDRQIDTYIHTCIDTYIDAQIDRYENYRQMDRYIDKQMIDNRWILTIFY